MLAFSAGKPMTERTGKLNYLLTKRTGTFYAGIKQLGKLTLLLPEKYLACGLKQGFGLQGNKRHAKNKFKIDY